MSVRRVSAITAAILACSGVIKISPAARSSETESPPATSKRQAILNAAADVFAEDGFAAASIDAIAARAGVSRHSVYNQLGDKDNLFKTDSTSLIDLK